MEEEILGRCQYCGFISQESNVRTHININHQACYDVAESSSEILLEDNNYVLEDTEHLSQESTLCDLENKINKNDEKIHWTHANVKLLLNCYEEQKEKFEDKSTPNKKIWKLISHEMMKQTGIKISPEQCENKYKNMKKTYKKIVDNNNSTGRGAINWEYFNLMDSILHKNPEVTPLSTCSSLEGPSMDINMLRSNKENMETPTRPAQSKKRKIPQTDEEPIWFKKYREEAQERHKEKMQKQDKLLELFSKLVDKE